ncbi:Protein kinase domain [Macleaya cordata]|uniref:Protein kinase domain n=1 Tax=Macleaya cordata TaxID=56857 RepID=A0A200QXB7_MACCD|nr:Protein kinase domain [Macleaya cordata]
MNQYHIYEAIGRGKYSTVYKARKKKTIEYFACKSVDKSHKNKVLQEVRILHSLDHPNVLKFYSWYETSAHLWLVLEYCVGGDLMTLLRQDCQLPEDSIHDLARDLVKALQFLHSKGIIYCDLKPSNILLDENGRTKLCDFGLARRLSDISKTPSSQLPQAKRGTPCYMAPELFQDGGVHSYASDFWALGCVLYECYAGRPPFVGNEFTQLVKSILSDPFPPLPGNPSRSFVSLINCLLIKDPAERVQWPDLCLHDFWRTKFTSVPLPPEPAFLDMIEQYVKPCLSERNGEKPLQSKTPPKSRERDSKGVLKHDENSISGARGLESPAKNAPSGKKTQTKAFGRTIVEKKKEFSSATRGVNLLRLSRIAKTNLQKENDKENYRRPLPKNSENDAEVKIENNDMELDFSENVEDEANDESDGSDPTCTTEEKLPSQTQDNERNGETDHNTNQMDSPPETHMDVSDDSQELEQESCLQHVEVAATPPSVGHQRKAKMFKAGLDSGSNSDSSKSSNNLFEVVWHASDLSVRPVMPSRKGDKASQAMPFLPFDAVPASDFIKMSKEHLDTLNYRIISILNGNNPVAEKHNVIRYLEMLSGNAEAANILTNGPIMLVLVKMLRLSKASALRVPLASVIGLLIRHSTFIEDDLASSGILGALTDGLRDKQEKVRRFAMAALGELLFYISTQSEQDRESNPPESPSKDSRSASGWQVPGPVIQLVSSVLRKGEDDLTQLYALRTIENICSQGGDWAARFTSQDVISNLCYIFKAVGKQESTRLTAGSCLVRLVRASPPSIQSVLEKLSFKDTASALVKGSPREQQISLNLLNMAMLGSHMFTNMNRHLLLLVEEKHLVPSLVSLIEQGTEVLRGKSLVFIALLCNNAQRWLPYFFCNAKLLSAVDRLAKEKDVYVQKCMDAFVEVVATTAPGLLKTITGEVQQIMGGRRHGQISSLTGRATSKTITHLFPVILHLLGSFSFKQRVVSPPVLQQLAILIKLVEVPFQGRDDMQITLLRILESITEELSFIIENPDVFISQVLPSLAVLYKGNKDGDARFLCLKLLFDVMVIFLNEPSEDEHRAESLKLISNTHFLPLYPTLIEDEDPIPMYAQKLLVMLIEFNYIKISDILHLKTVSQCFEFLLGDLSSANVNDVKLCLALASAPELETKILSQLRVVRKIGNLLEFVNAKDMEDFLEPTLALCKAFLLRVMGSLKGAAVSKEPALLGDGSFDTRVADQQNYIKDITDFGSNVGVFLELSGSNEARVADLASESLILLLKAAPREATIGLLTNLPKVSRILESWSHGVSSLLLQRMLHALGYSCRQYMSQAMILSISISEITKIEAIVSSLKTSSIPGVADAAFVVGLELQRLPRCK